MAEMSVIWLRVAAALYSLGLLHAILTLVRRREHLFRVALGAFGLASVFHFVSIVEEGIVSNRCPITNFYETLSMCAFLLVLLYLFAHWRYKLGKPERFRLPAGVRGRPGGHHGESGQRLVEPGGAQCLAHGAYRSGSAGVCGAACWPPSLRWSTCFRSAS